MSIKIVKCNRCGHEWATRKKKDPTWCPKCKSPYWNKKRHSKKEKVILCLIKKYNKEYWKTYKRKIQK